MDIPSGLWNCGFKSVELILTKNSNINCFVTLSHYFYNSNDSWEFAETDDIIEKWKCENVAKQIKFQKFTALLKNYPQTSTSVDIEVSPKETQPREAD